MKTTAPTDGGCIINITATLQDHATPFQLHAAAAKAGIDVATNTMGVEWAEYGIRSVGIAPGGIAGTVGGPDGRVFGSNQNNTAKNASGYGNPRFGPANACDADCVGFVPVLFSSYNAAIGDGAEPDKLRNDGIPAGRWGRVQDVAFAALCANLNKCQQVATLNGGAMPQVPLFTCCNMGNCHPFGGGRWLCTSRQRVSGTKATNRGQVRQGKGLVQRWCLKTLNQFEPSYHCA